VFGLGLIFVGMVLQYQPRPKDDRRSFVWDLQAAEQTLIAPICRAGSRLRYSGCRHEPHQRSAVDHEIALLY
jgi:hypothetical protein